MIQITSGEGRHTTGTAHSGAVNSGARNSQTGAASSPPQQQQAAARSVAAMVSLAGLPAGNLSASVVSFSRFFSLPLRPELMAAIRRQAVSVPPPPAATSSESPLPSSPVRQAVLTAQTQGEAAGYREALALAAAAAESKGVKLTTDGLEAFAAAIDPDRQNRQGRKRQDEESDKKEREKTSPDSDIPLSGSELKKKALEAAEKNPLLALLNNLPGKDGRRWIVIPFCYNSGGKELQVSMRVLVDGDAPREGRFCRMVLDIAENRADLGRAGERRLFSIEQKDNAKTELTVFAECGEQTEVYIRELSLRTGIPPEQIIVQNRAEKFPCEHGCADGLLPFVNESV